MENKNMQENTKDILSTIGQQKPPRKRRGLKYLLAIFLIHVAVFSTIYLRGGDQKTLEYITEEARIGNLVVTVSASGTVQPTQSIDVGSELSGTLTEVLVQENDFVKKGQILAQLDLAKLKDAVTRTHAALASSRASVAQTEASVAETKASLARMRHVAELSGGKVPSQLEIETAEASLKRAIANEASARAAVVQAEAELKTNQTNLEKGTIRSPVDGVVLLRKVEPGQTVAATMSTPVLFTLAEDLTKMELQVQVDEADVAGVKVGQLARFTVSAWPRREFPAKIERVGIGSTTTNNVVTYKTILEVENNDLSLRPGMTANATIITAERNDVLTVPNAALRFTPPEKNAKPKGSFLSRFVPRPPQDQKKPVAAAQDNSAQQVWIMESEGQIRAIAVQSGATNGRITEITGGELKAGMQVITDYQDARS